MLRRLFASLLVSLLCGLPLASTATAQLTITPTLRRTVANTWTAVQTFSLGIIGTPIIGGTATTSDLVLQTTSGVGASGADMHFLVGNNGATEAMTILNSGKVGIMEASPEYGLAVEAAETTLVRFGANKPVYFIADNPYVGLNLYYSGGWKYGAGSSSSYASYIGFNAFSGLFSIGITSAAGNAAGAATVTDILSVLPTGRAGVNTTAPDKAAEINSATGVNLRLTYNDSNGSAANYTDFSTTSTGDFITTPVGTNPMHIIGTATAPLKVTHNKAYAMADAATVGLMTFDLPTADTSCGVHISFIYTVTDAGTNTNAHVGIAVAAINNDDGVVSGTMVDAGEVAHGTGCAAACESWTVTNPSGTLAQINANFNNSLSVAGSLTWSIINNTCGTFTRL